MYYRIRTDLAYPEDLNPKALFNHAKSLAPQSVVINPGQPNAEKGYVILEQCYHDEDPTKPCVPLFSWP